MSRFSWCLFWQGRHRQQSSFPTRPADELGIVLWHEFCHVITLQKTGNKIPRWLSEGISVFEERRADVRWVST